MHTEKGGQDFLGNKMLSVKISAVNGMGEGGWRRGSCSSTALPSHLRAETAAGPDW